MSKIALKCDACGANELKRKNEYYVCEFCGSKYLIEGNSISEKTITDAKIISYYYKAAEHMLKGNYAEELKVLTEALSLDEENAITLTKIGRCYRALGFKDKALETYKKALEIDPNNGASYANIGALLIIEQNWSEAAKHYVKGLSLVDKNSDDYWIGYANYAVVVAKLGDAQKAETMIREAESHGYKDGDGCRSLAGISKKGCYIATCVYGSYDCPEVWTLRRFRDNTLDSTLYGRIFIKFYYVVSPVLVNLFGNKGWFRTFWKNALDNMVKSLNNHGVEDTPYSDRY